MVKAEEFGEAEDFNCLLQEYAGISACAYKAYLYYDDFGNFIGDGDELTLSDLLSAAGVEVTND